MSFAVLKANFSLLKSSATVIGSQTSAVVSFLRNISPFIMVNKLQFTHFTTLLVSMDMYEVFFKDSKYLNEST